MLGLLTSCIDWSDEMMILRCDRQNTLYPAISNFSELELTEKHDTRSFMRSMSMVLSTILQISPAQCNLKRKKKNSSMLCYRSGL
jgi:hypothetical protein